MLSRGGIGFASFAGALLAFGCVDSDLDAGERASRASQELANAIDRYCSSQCRRLAQCTPGGSQLACTSYCKASDFPARIANATLNYVAGCYDQSSCAAFADESVYTTCFAQATAATTPSEQCENFCLLDVTQSFECGGGYDVERCLTNGACTWSDRVLATAADCEDLDCEARQQCLESVFGATE